MTLDEAIKHAEEVAEDKENEGKLLCQSEGASTGCLTCAEEHRQLAEWLKDYKRLKEQESCEDCISREKAIKALEYDLSIEADGGLDKYRTVIKDLLNAIYNTQKKAIEDLPSVQPKPKTGHWIKGKCSECEKEGLLESTGEYVCDTFVYQIAHSKYCPNCGVKMVEPQESEE